MTHIGLSCSVAAAERGCRNPSPRPVQTSRPPYVVGRPAEPRSGARFSGGRTATSPGVSGRWGSRRP
jgi:hypothetical protein